MAVRLFATTAICHASRQLPKIQFTKRVLDALPAPTNRRTEYTDVAKSRVSILRLEVTSSGGKYWRLRYRSPVEVNRQGKKVERRAKLGTYPALSIEEARIQARQVQVLIDQGHDPAAMKEAEEADTVSALWQRFKKQHLAHKSASYIYDFTRNFERDVLPTIGHKSVAKLRKQEISQIWERAAARSAKKFPGRPNAGVRQGKEVQKNIRAFLNYCEESGWIDANPLGRVRYMASTNAPRDRHLSMREVARFWVGLDSCRMADEMKCLLRIQLATGMRHKEIREGLLDEIDLDLGEWTMPASKTKNGLEHRFPLNEQAIMVISDAVAAFAFKRGSSGLLLPGFPRDKLRDGTAPQPIGKSAPANAVRKNLNMLGIEKFTPHDLRRTMRTQMGEAGVDTEVARRLTNHISGDTIERTYDRSRRWGAMVEAIKIWGEALAAAVGFEHTKVVNLHEGRL